MARSGLTSRFKKGIATILSAFVLLTGVLAITPPLTAAASTAPATSTTPVFHKSKDGKDVTVTINGVTVFEAKQSSDNDAEVTYTAKGKNIKLKMHVDKIANGEYKSTITDENTKESKEYVSKNHPIMNKANPSIVTDNTPNAIVYAI